MVKHFTFAELKPIYDAERRFVIGVYLWMHEYCVHYLEDNPEIDQVVLTMTGEGVGQLEGKVYKFKRDRPEDVKLTVNKD